MPDVPIKIVILGLKPSVVEDAITVLEDPVFEFIGCTTVDELKTALESGDITDVFIGAGIDLETRLEAVRTVFATSQGTHIHMKKAGGGPKTFEPFIRTTLLGLKVNRG